MLLFNNWECVSCNLHMGAVIRFYIIYKFPIKYILGWQNIIVKYFQFESIQISSICPSHENLLNALSQFIKLGNCKLGATFLIIYYLLEIIDNNHIVLTFIIRIKSVVFLVKEYVKHSVEDLKLFCSRVEQGSKVRG